MKQLSTLRNVVGAMAALALMAACQNGSTNQAELAASKKEFLVAQSGFKVITVTTPKQQQAINGLAQYRVSAVKYNGKLYYVFPTATRDKIYVGKQKKTEEEGGRGGAGGEKNPAPDDDIRDCGTSAHRGRRVRRIWFNGGHSA